MLDVLDRVNSAPLGGFNSQSLVEVLINTVGFALMTQVETSIPQRLNGVAPASSNRVPGLRSGSNPDTDLAAD